MRRVTLALLLVAVMLPVEVRAFERIASGLDAYDAGDFLLASRLWEDDARVLQRSAVTPYDKKVAALAFVLSSMSAARAKNREAYDLWGEAQSLLAELGTRWSEQAAEYRAAVARLANPSSAQVSFEEGAIIELSDSDLQLQRFSGTGVLNYEKPPSGLVGVAQSEGQNTSVAPDETTQNENSRRVLSNRSSGFRPDYAPEDEDEDEDQEEPAEDVMPLVQRSGSLGQAAAPSGKDEGPSGSVLVFRRASDSEEVVEQVTPGTERDVMSVRSLAGAAASSADPVLSNRGGVPAGQELGADEQLWARVAWRYFEEAEQSVSGLADSHPGHARVSVWDIGSHIAGLVSAHQLDVITDLAFAQRVELLLGAVEDLPLYEDALPNRNYTSDTVELLDATGTPAPIGSGWSAVDIGRLLIWLKILSNYYPLYSETIASIVNGWDLSKAVDEQTLVGTFRKREGVETFREGRFGFEHYAAQGYVLWGAMPAGPGFENTQIVKVGDFNLSIDSRPGSATNGYALMLLQTELGCFAEALCDSLAAALSVQKEAARRRGKSVAVSDYHLDKAPWFATTNFALSGKDWSSVSVEGGRLPDAQMSLFTTKAAFLSDALDGDSTVLMADAAEDLQASSGFWEGRYVDGSVNRTLSLSTNAAVLQALWYRRHGGSFLNRTGGVADDGDRKTLLIRRF